MSTQSFIFGEYEPLLLWGTLLANILVLLVGLIVLVRLKDKISGTSGEVRDELRLGREEARSSSTDLRKELGFGLHNSMEGVRGSLKDVGDNFVKSLDRLRIQINEDLTHHREQMEKMRETLDSRVREMQQGNERKLDEMRRTVDEKLHDTLEKRLGESFRFVSERLESVQKGLGEMQKLATGVGDLQRVLTNVKVRGTWAEVQLEALLEQMLTKGQYSRNVRVIPETLDHVEFTVDLPGSSDEPDRPIRLPIDSKFPQEDYLRLQEASEKADQQGVLEATKSLVKTLKEAARSIHEKYIHPPHTTDFAIMFLPTEGLYAELLREPGLLEDIQQKYRVIVAGPTNLMAILSSLRMGFQTLAIEERASEVWKVLGAVKSEFGKFGGILEKLRKQLNTATNTLDETDRRTRVMQKALKTVSELHDQEKSEILGLDGEMDSILEEEQI